MELWAAVDGDGNTNVFASEPILKSGVKVWECKSEDEEWTYEDGLFTPIACRGVQPGQKRKLKVFDPIREVVEYEDTLEEKHQRLVDASLSLRRGVMSYPGFICFLDSEGYIQ